jgi:hypothetical protein
MPGLSLFSSGKLKKGGVEEIGIRNAFIQIVRQAELSAGHFIASGGRSVL